VKINCQNQFIFKLGRTMQAKKIPLKQSAVSGVYLIPDQTDLSKLSDIQLCSVLNRIRQNYVDLILWSESQEPFCLRCLNPNAPKLIPDHFWQHLGIAQPDKKCIKNYMCRHCEEFFKVCSQKNDLKASIDILKVEHSREVQKYTAARAKAKCVYSRKKGKMTLKLAKLAKDLKSEESKSEELRKELAALKTSKENSDVPKNVPKNGKMEPNSGLKQHMESAHLQSSQDFSSMPEVPDVRTNIKELTSGNIQGGKIS
jgi:hypothetical protein